MPLPVDPVRWTDLRCSLQCRPGRGGRELEEDGMGWEGKKVFDIRM